MAQLLVRGLSDETVRQLKQRAKARGRSVEAEHRAILEEATKPAMTTAEWIAGLQEMTWLAELDPDSLRDRNYLGREFDFDPEKGTTVRHVWRDPGHDGSGGSDP